MDLSDPLPFAGFISKILLRTLPPHSPSPRAVTETEYPAEGDDWFWTDDNAKVLELMALPAVWRHCPDDVADILRFLTGMCDGGFIFRRLARNRLVMLERDGGRARFVHSLLDIDCDLARGAITLGMRFHDGRDARNITLTGNYVGFRYRDKNYAIDVEDGIVAHAIDLGEDRLGLSFEAELSFRPHRFASPLRLGRVVYRIDIRANSAFVDVEAALTMDPVIAVDDVTLTFGFDDASHGVNNVRYETLRAAFPAAPAVVRKSGLGGLQIPAVDCHYWSIAQNSEINGFAIAVHSLPRPGSPLHSINATSNKAGELHWLVAEHRFAGRQSGTLVAGERKIITSGGFYEDADAYAAMLPAQAARSDAGGPAIDLSVSYDYGAEVLALASCYRALSADMPPVDDPALRAELRGRIDGFRDFYQAHFIAPFRAGVSAVFSRSVAFMALAYADMFAETADPAYEAALREACEIILTFERVNADVAGQAQSAFVMGRDAGAMPHVDCHSACLLALVRASNVLADPVWERSIDRGLASFRLDTTSILFGKVLYKQDLVAVDFLGADGVRHAMPAFWNYHSGLTLRMLNALRASPVAELQAVWVRHAPRMSVLEALMRQRVGQCLRERDGTIEIRTSVLSGETNSETQPWVAIALLGSDSTI
jgi:hypothetical protein